MALHTGDRSNIDETMPTASSAVTPDESKAAGVSRMKKVRFVTSEKGDVMHANETLPSSSVIKENSAAAVANQKTKQSGSANKEEVEEGEYEVEAILSHRKVSTCG